MSSRARGPHPSRWVAGGAGLAVGGTELQRSSCRRACAIPRPFRSGARSTPPPPPAHAPAQLEELAAPGFQAQLGACLRRNFTMCVYVWSAGGAGSEGVPGPLQSSPAAPGRFPGHPLLSVHPPLCPAPALTSAPRRSYNRAPEYNLTRALITLLVGFLFGTMFWRQGDNRRGRGAGARPCVARLTRLGWLPAALQRPCLLTSPPAPCLPLAALPLFRSSAGPRWRGS